MRARVYGVARGALVDDLSGEPVLAWCGGGISFEIVDEIGVVMVDSSGAVFVGICVLSGDIVEVVGLFVDGVFVVPECEGVL